MNTEQAYKIGYSHYENSFDGTVWAGSDSNMKPVHKMSKRQRLNLYDAWERGFNDARKAYAEKTEQQ